MKNERRLAEKRRDAERRARRAAKRNPSYI